MPTTLTAESEPLNPEDFETRTDLRLEMAELVPPDPVAEHIRMMLMSEVVTLTMDGIEQEDDALPYGVRLIVLGRFGPFRNDTLEHMFFARP